MTREASAGELAAAITGAATTAGATTPAVRGADWRLGVVTAVNGDGTISVGDIRARRLADAYPNPLPGETAVLTQNSAGNWLAIGRLATDSGTWTALTLTDGYINPGRGYAACWMREGRRIYLCGRIGRTSGTIANGATIATIPAAIRPAGAVAVGWATARDTAANPAVCRVEITETGVLRTYETASPPSWISLDGITYTI